MKSTPDNAPSAPDLSGLSPTEMAGVISDLQQQLQASEQALASQREQHEQAIRQRDTRIDLLEEMLRLKTLQKFAASSEKHRYQVTLFDEAEVEAEIEALREEVGDDDDEPDPDEPPRPARKCAQRGFSAALRRKRIELTLSDEEKAGATKTFFTKVKEELEYIPAQLNVLEYWQERAVFEHDDGEEAVVGASRPVHPLGKCMATTSLLAHIITSKYADGLPLYRLESMLARLGHPISRTSMAHWIIRLNEVFKPLINLMREAQNTSDYLQADETRLQVLKEDGKTAQSDKWIWVTRGGPPGQPTVLFEYDPSRAGSVPVRLLDDFNGILQADGYSGYGKVCRDNAITRIGCWDHARRKFVEASKAAPSKKKGKGQRQTAKADVALGHIRKLYAIERRIKEMGDDERYRIRQAESLPRLQAFKSWLDANADKVAKGSLTRKAMDYALNQWETLVGYCQRGDLQISNALAENAIRPFALGRRAWLFADTARGANASATCYSLIETARANGLEPSAYIHHLLNHIAEADTVEKLEALLPWNTDLEPAPKKS
ncbi:IS66 family transposase [Halospina sp. K52047b]|uniref:IS66 family transposase n=1 Tax=Halospina sp. K52047b TaxID=2614160 RepID=UPI00124A1FA1|nr:IS66 family transposase [Halospina sp. K52047b]KAA8976587.1 IS66 family transposase [Halospina sp. K52047b]